MNLLECRFLIQKSRRKNKKQPERVVFYLGKPYNDSVGPIVKWYYAAFALLRREFDSPWVHHEKKSGILSRSTHLLLARVLESQALDDVCDALTSTAAVV